MLVLHFVLVAFVVGGLFWIVIGNLLHWRSANALWFRLLHLSAIAIVAAEAWFGITCPLTTFEISLRAKSGATIAAGMAASGEGFVGYWLHRLLFYSAPPWLFIVAYTAFGLLVIAVWFWFPPRRHRSAKR